MSKLTEPLDAMVQSGRTSDSRTSDSRTSDSRPAGPAAKGPPARRSKGKAPPGPEPTRGIAGDPGGAHQSNPTDSIPDPPAPQEPPAVRLGAGVLIRPGQRVFTLGGDRHGIVLSTTERECFVREIGGDRETWVSEWSDVVVCADGPDPAYFDFELPDDPDAIDVAGRLWKHIAWMTEPQKLTLLRSLLENQAIPPRPGLVEAEPITDKLDAWIMRLTELSGLLIAARNLCFETSNDADQDSLLDCASSVGELSRRANDDVEKLREEIEHLEAELKFGIADTSDADEEAEEPELPQAGPEANETEADQPANADAGLNDAGESRATEGVKRAGGQKMTSAEKRAAFGAMIRGWKDQAAGVMAFLRQLEAAFETMSGGCGAGTKAASAGGPAGHQVPDGVTRSGSRATEAVPESAKGSECPVEPVKGVFDRFMQTAIRGGDIARGLVTMLDAAAGYDPERMEHDVLRPGSSIAGCVVAEMEALYLAADAAWSTPGLEDVKVRVEESKAV